jgi:hypothetical protein
MFAFLLMYLFLCMAGGGLFQQLVMLKIVWGHDASILHGCSGSWK